MQNNGVSLQLATFFLSFLVCNVVDLLTDMLGTLS